MRRLASTRLIALCALATLAPLVAHADGADFSGQVGSYRLDRQTATTGPLAQANALQPGTAAVEGSTNPVQAELRGNAAFGLLSLHASATLQSQQSDSQGSSSQSRFNEAYASASVGTGWQWSAGKRVVSLDVGYGFRPNDLVQQEVRRALVADPLQGRPLLMVERFDADTAWTLVWVNPTQPASTLGPQEAALAARGYWHSGAVDWHVFARQGEHTGISLGAAASWVASDALELHTSVRGGQQLVGGTWTHESQVSLLLEAWHDSTALTDAQWSAWSARNLALCQGLAHGMPVAAVAGTLARQANAFGVASNLRQNNLFARLSWQHDRWQTALDLLYTPADRGAIATASVVWTGERIKLEAGLRATAGPGAALVRQLPVQRQEYVVASWAF
ncbi:MAG: hypothetical protein ACTS8S_01600 [Giesbergeria sp.]